MPISINDDLRDRGIRAQEKFRKQRRTQAARRVKQRRASTSSTARARRPGASASQAPKSGGALASHAKGLSKRAAKGIAKGGVVAGTLATPFRTYATPTSDYYKRFNIQPGQHFDTPSDSWYGKIGTTIADAAMNAITPENDGTIAGDLLPNAAIRTLGTASDLADNIVNAGSLGMLDIKYPDERSDGGGIGLEFREPGFHPQQQAPQTSQKQTQTRRPGAADQQAPDPNSDVPAAAEQPASNETGGNQDKQRVGPGPADIFSVVPDAQKDTTPSIGLLAAERHDAAIRREKRLDRQTARVRKARQARDLGERRETLNGAIEKAMGMVGSLKEHRQLLGLRTLEALRGIAAERVDTSRLPSDGTDANTAADNALKQAKARMAEMTVEQKKRQQQIVQNIRELAKTDPTKARALAQYYGLGGQQPDYELATIATTTPMGKKISRQVPVNMRTGEYMGQVPGQATAQPQLTDKQILARYRSDPRYDDYSDKELLAYYRKQGA